MIVINTQGEPFPHQALMSGDFYISKDGGGIWHVEEWDGEELNNDVPNEDLNEAVFTAEMREGYEVN